MSPQFGTPEKHPTPAAQPQQQAEIPYVPAHTCCEDVQQYAAIKAPEGGVLRDPVPHQTRDITINEEAHGD